MVFLHMSLVKGCVSCGEEYDYEKHDVCPHCGFVLDDGGGIEEFIEG